MRTGRRVRGAPLEQHVTTPDGRRLCFAVLGPADGRPMIHCHGAPSSRLEAVALSHAYRRHGVRAIAIDRPGCGGSTPQPERGIADFAGDIALVADHLGLGRFDVLGYSGGGPYAIACGALLADRVGTVVSVSGAGRPDRPGGNRAADIVGRELDRLVERLPAVARVFLSASAWSVGRLGDLAPGRVAGSLYGGEQRALRELRSVGLGPADPLLETFRQGSGGAVLDLRLLLEPWPFTPTDVRVPVQLWHGDDDRNVPLHHSVDLDRVLRQSELRALPGENHFLIYRHIDDILDALPAP